MPQIVLNQENVVLDALCIMFSGETVMVLKRKYSLKDARWRDVTTAYADVRRVTMTVVVCVFACSDDVTTLHADVYE